MNHDIIDLFPTPVLRAKGVVPPPLVAVSQRRWLQLLLLPSPRRHQELSQATEHAPQGSVVPPVL
jgi:hypothetical protein